MRNFNKANAILVFLALFIVYGEQGYAQPGIDGAKTISAANTVVNEYTYLTANASAGNTSLAVAGSSLNTHSRFAASLAQGDLVMIIQMQGAAITGSPVNDSTWGAITSYNNSGLYEFSEVSGVPNGTTINLNCPLKNNYTAAGNVQVVRVPRVSSLTINNGGVLTGDAWNGTSGGIVATEVQNNTVINTGGSIVATAIGFRGAVAQNTSGGANNIGFASTSSALGGAKGEGIAGYETGYTVYGGMYGRGAPANAGGGGDQWNASGGGGANAGNINAYTGNGNPDTSNSSWVAAWNLEYPGFAYSTSSGGGRGGYTIEWFPTGTPSPLVYPPGNPVWGDTSASSERNRENGGGKGGRPLDYSTGRIFAAGGGGAGHEDQGLGGSGGNGGGIVYLLSYGTVSGGGSIISNGQNGGADNSTGNLGDGCGGAGGGGTVIVYSTNTISGISITANGGTGGNQYISSSYEDEGPGGGGGGGYIAISNGSISTQALGGVNGTTNSPLMTLFPADGATKGGSGFANDTISNIPFGSVNTNVSGNVSICEGDSASLTASGGTTYLWGPDTGLSCSNCANTKAAPSATTAYTVTVSNGTCVGTGTVMVTILQSVQTGTISANPDTLCTGGSSQLTLTGSTGSIQWQSSTNGNSFTNLPGDTLTTLNENNLNQTTYYRIEATGGCGTDSSQATAINVLSFPATGSIIPNPDTICAGGTSRLNLSGVSAPVQWQISNSPGIFTDITGTDSSVYTTPPLNQSVSFRVIANNGYCADTSAVISLLVNPAPVPPILSTNDSLICSSDSTRINTSGSYSSYSWNNGDTRPYTYAQYAGGYWVTVTDANGCSATSEHKEISVFPVTSVSIIQSGNSMSSFGEVSYQWYDNSSPIPGATQPFYTATQSGDYTVLVTDTNGCTELSTDIEIVVSGVKDVVENNGVTIYPNPFTNSVSVEILDPAIKINQAEIYDVLGREVFSKEYMDSPVNPLVLDVSYLPAGTYYLKIWTGKDELVKEIIK